MTFEVFLNPDILVHTFLNKISIQNLHSTWNMSVIPVCLLVLYNCVSI